MSPTPPPTPPLDIGGYIRFETGGCIGRNELGPFTVNSAQECATKCNERDTCVSFEYEKDGTACQLSTSCNDFSLTVNKIDDAYRFYLKDVRSCFCLMMMMMMYFIT